jgi:hypothetical protein
VGTDVRGRQPVAFRWQTVEVVDPRTGEMIRRRAMVPLPRYGNVCVRQFGADDADFVLEEVIDRDMRSHNAFFAEVNELYENVPEHIAFMRNPDGTFMLDDHEQKILRWPTAIHFRRWLLIEVGWCDEKEFECANREHAKNLGKFLRVEDDYSRIRIQGSQVVVKKARSQRVDSMRAAEFEDSKKAVLELARAMVDVTAAESRRSAGRSG